MIDRVVELIFDRFGEAASRPLVVGIAGGVGVGKTTLANALAAELAARDITTLVVATDNFLFPNVQLAERGLLMRKGFPETYDVELIASTIDTLRSGRPAVVPVYDHQTYDVLDERVRVDPTDVLLLEGVNVLQAGVRERLDVAMYLDVDVDHARQWFFDRFAVLCEIGEGFYAPFASMTPDQRDAVAASAWEGINLVNLEQHIAPTKHAAGVVVRKDADHAIVDVVVG